MKNQYGYEEYSLTSPKIKNWADKISKADGRPNHPEDYVDYAVKLVNKSKNIKHAEDFDMENRLFEMIIALDKHFPCHRDYCYSFLDWFNYIVNFMERKKNEK